MRFFHAPPRNSRNDLRRRSVKNIQKSKILHEENGVFSLLGGVINWDKDWRNRDSFSKIEPSELSPRVLTKAQVLALKSCETNIEFISGKPGGGKSMFATKLIVDELLKGHRPIVTNMALNLTRLQEYIHQLGGDAHVLSRVRILEHDEVFRFYLYRGCNLILPCPHTGGLIDFVPSQTDEEAAGGVFYVIDECHNYFNTKAPIDETSTMFKWASQHRKLKDICFLVTQSIENVHAKVRRLGQQFNYIRNFRKESFRGFRRGDGFKRFVYLSIPSGNESIPVLEEDFKLDVKGLASCYYTAGGVGVSPIGGADAGYQKKGLHMRWVWVFLVLCILIIAVTLLTVSSKLGTTAGKLVDIPASGSVVKETVKTDSKVKPESGPQSVSHVAPVQIQEERTILKSPSTVFPTGILWRGPVLIVQMSDGSRRWRDTRLSEYSDDIKKASSSGVVLDGEKVFLRSSPHPQTASIALARNNDKQEMGPSDPTPDTTGWAFDRLSGSNKLVLPSALGEAPEVFQRQPTRNRR